MEQDLAKNAGDKVSVLCLSKWESFQEHPGSRKQIMLPDIYGPLTFDI